VPIFDHVCQHCGAEFETLVLRPSDRIRCPTCGSEDLKRVASLFSCTSVQLNKRLKMESEEQMKKGQEMMKKQEMRKKRIKIL
jgi:putative FmdB family regulatory protein